MEKPDEVGSDSEASEPLQYSSKDKDLDSSSFSRKVSTNYYCPTFNGIISLQEM